MTDIAVPPALATDPNGRDPARTPMQWDMSLVSAGFSNERPWLPTPAHGVDVASQRADPDSLLNLYRRLLQLRHTHPCLRSDSYEDVEAGPDVNAYRRTCGTSKLMVLLNFADAHRPVAAARDRMDARLILSTHRRELSTVVDPHELVLAPNEAVIVELDAMRA
jgi:alpha-glucosidase